MKSRGIILAALAAILIFGVVVFLRAPHKAMRPVKAKKKAVVSIPAPRKAATRAKVAIVMDDFGYNMNNFDALFSIGQPVTLSILPDLR